jgi:hypothetical protein
MTFRPPSVPLFNQSPLFTLWSNSDTLYGQSTTQWTGDECDFTGMIRVDSTVYTWMGAASGPTCQQLSLDVFSTQTIYKFTCGDAVSFEAKFTSPLLTDNWELLSRPAQYLTFSVTTSRSASVSIYVDFANSYVMADPQGLITWDRDILKSSLLPNPIIALKVGASKQTPLSSTADRPSWGLMYMLVDSSTASASLDYATVTRQAFMIGKPLPSDNPNTPGPSTISSGQTGPQVGIDRPGNDMTDFDLPSNDPDLCWAQCNATKGCTTWAFGISSVECPETPHCWLKSAASTPQTQPCRVSGTSLTTPLVLASEFDLGMVSPSAIPISRFVVLSVDEVLILSYFGENCPPYWRRSLPVGDTSTPTDMLVQAYSTHTAVMIL